MSASPIRKPSPINAATSNRFGPPPVSADGGGLAAATGDATTVGEAAVTSEGVAGGGEAGAALAVGAAVAVGVALTLAAAVGADVTTGLPVGDGPDARAAQAREPSTPGADAHTERPA
jgi:hypothetical protein